MSDHSALRQGKVIRAEDRHLIVRVKRAACARCENGHGCGAGLFNRLIKPDYFDIPIATNKVPTRLAHVGSEISLRIDDALLLHAALRVYGLTILAFVIGGIGGHYLIQDSVSPALLDFFVLMAGLTSAIVTSWLCSKSWNSLNLDQAISCDSSCQKIQVTIE